MKAAKNVLLVDDDEALRQSLAEQLDLHEEFICAQAATGGDGLELAKSEHYDLILLDVGLPDLDGREVCRELRRRSAVPIVFLSSKSEELDRVLGLELGGDAYLAKPFSPRELVSQCKAILRRTRGAVTSDEEAAAGPLQVGPIVLDPVAFECRIEGTDAGLTVTEFRLLQVLMETPGRAFTRDELALRAYPDRRFVAGRTVDSHIRRIRHKLRDGGGGDPIETVHGLGYRLRKG